MSNNGFIFYYRFVKYLLHKHKRKNKIDKILHNTRILEIQKFIDKIDNKLKIDDEDYYYAAIFLHKLYLKRFNINYKNMKRYVLGTILISHKFNDDFCHDNIDWANALGYPLKYLNGIEKDVLDFLEFKLFFSKKEYHSLIEYINYKLDNNKVRYVYSSLKKRFNI